mgnify:CR=1 FL=1
MSKIDWRFLLRPLIMLGVGILVSAALVVAGYQYEAAQQEDYDKAVGELRATHKRYSNLVRDLELIEQYRSLYNEYKASGLVGKERRLSWVESLQSANQVLRLPTLTYNLLPQEDFKRPNFTVKRDVVVKSSPMDLTIGMLHEEDLFALLEVLRQSITSLFTVDSCSITRSTAIGRSLDTKKPNLRTRCTIRWVTIDAK